MNFLPNKGNRVILLVGLCVGCIALAQPYMTAFFSTEPEDPAISEVNRQSVKFEEVRVVVPKLRQKKRSIDLNSAGVKRLQELNGIGEVLAERIVSYRRQSGEFEAVSELKEVRGLGEATVGKLSGRLVVD